MARVVKLPQPGEARSAARTGAVGAGDLAALLHWVFAAAPRDGAGPEVRVRVESCPPLPPGDYGYRAPGHELVAVRWPHARTASSVGDDAPSPVSLLLHLPGGGGEPSPRLLAAAHRLVMAAAELDLGPRLEVAGGTIRVDLGAGLEPAAATRPGATRLQAVLTVAAARCRAPLLPPESWQRLVDTAAQVRLASRDIGLECRLQEAAHRVDLAAAVETRLHGVPRAQDLANPERLAPGWHAIDRLRSALAASPALQRRTRHLGLELDLPPRAHQPLQVPAPGLFVGLLDGCWCHEVEDAVRAGLPALMGEAAYRDFEGELDCFLAALPPGSVLHYFGAFAGRDTGVARFNVQYPAPAAAREALRRQGFPRRYLEALERAVGTGARLVLALDVGATPGRRLGLEHLFDQPSGVEAVLDDLVDRGLCSAAKREAVLAWPGALQEADAHAPWPAPLQAACRRSAGVRSVVLFKLSHLKVVVSDQGESAKAYLQLQHAWVPPRRTLPFMSALQQPVPPG